jgi:hypothetical protein
MAIKNVIELDAVRPALADWWRRYRAAAREVVVSDAHIPQSSGMSSETVIFRVDWVEDGLARTAGR